jgi:hypothetical protein
VTLVAPDGTRALPVEAVVRVTELPPPHDSRIQAIAKVQATATD